MDRRSRKKKSVRKTSTKYRGENEHELRAVINSLIHRIVQLEEQAAKQEAARQDIADLVRIEQRRQSALNRRVPMDAPPLVRRRVVKETDPESLGLGDI